MSDVTLPAETFTDAELIEQARMWPKDGIGEGRWFNAMADRIELLRGLLNTAKEEHYCGPGSDCKSPFCVVMRETGQ